MTRTENTIKNIIIALITQAASILLSMISRSAFISTLGADLLGISGLFASAISVLALSELGLGEAMLYLMIKYFAEDDRSKIKAAFEFSKKIYFVVSLIIIGIGIAITPIVFMTINLDTPIPHLYLYYYIFILNTAFSYFCAPYNVVFRAEQKNRVVTKSAFWSNIAITFSQIVCLYLFKSYILYLILMMMGNFISYAYIRFMFNRDYAFLKNKNIDYTLGNKEKNEIKHVVKDMFIVKVSGVIMESIDNITISKIIGTVIVGIYSNYIVITKALRTFIKLIYQSLYSSIGNLNMSDTVEKRKKFFEIEIFIFHIMATISITGTFILIQDFMKIWIGKEYLLSDSIVIVACVDFYFNIIEYALVNFLQTSYLFKKSKFTSLGMAICNLILSITLGMKMGLVGILLATVISRLVMRQGICVMLVYKDLFLEKANTYYNMILKYVLAALSEVLIIYLITYSIDGTVWYMFIMKLILTMCLSLAILWLMHKKNPAYEYLKNTMEETVRKKLGKYKRG